jgi:hypothetical protein
MMIEFGSWCSSVVGGTGTVDDRSSSPSTPVCSGLYLTHTAVTPYPLHVAECSAQQQSTGSVANAYSIPFVYHLYVICILFVYYLYVICMLFVCYLYIIRMAWYVWYGTGLQRR